jgi:hypothetical protein
MEMTEDIAFRNSGRLEIANRWTGLTLYFFLFHS